jgi:uncharacterized protein involved in outer membrane biogenesis
MRLRYRILGVLVIALLLLVVAPALVPANNIRVAVERAASELVGLPVSISRLSLRLLPDVGFSISEAVIQETKEAGDRVYARARSGRVSLALIPLLLGRLEPTALAFRDVDLNMPEAAGEDGPGTVHMDAVSGFVDIEEEGLTLSGWKADLYGGEMDMAARLSFQAGEGKTLEGDLHGKGIRLLPLLRDVYGKTVLAGTLNSDVHFSSRGVTRSEIERNLVVDGPVRILEGSVYGTNLTDSAVTLLGGRAKDGSIPFDELRFHLLAYEGQAELKNIRLAADTIDARGQVQIASDMVLSGRIEASGLGGLLRMDLALAGTVEQPRVSLMPSESGTQGDQRSTSSGQDAGF